MASGSGPAPTTYRAASTALAAAGVIDDRLGATLGDAAGTRDLLVHRYALVDLSIIAASLRPLRAATGDLVVQGGRWLAEQA